MHPFFLRANYGGKLEFVHWATIYDSTFVRKTLERAGVECEEYGVGRSGNVNPYII